MFEVTHWKKLKWCIQVSGSKNAALPIIAANCILPEKINLRNKPQISDVQVMERLIDQAEKNNQKDALDLTSKYAQKIRSCILLIPYGLIKYWKVVFANPGWCKIWKRSMSTFDDALHQAGIKISQNKYKSYKISGKPAKQIILKEFSVTATESLITYLAFANNFDYKINIKQIAIEPHVINLIDFLKNVWAQIQINYDHSITIAPSKIKIKQKEFEIIWDYIEAGTFFSIAAATNNSEITITNFNTNDLVAVYSLADSIWINYEIIDQKTLKVNSYNKNNYKPVKLQTWIFPWFPTDLQSIFGVLLTQIKWISKIHETLFEWRFTYLAEMENLGAKIEILNPHQVIIIWKSILQWGYVNTTDLRGWWAMLLAGILAKWKTYITDEDIILRWYEDIEKKLKSIWVEITRC